MLMTKKNVFLIAVLVLLGALGVYLNKDRFGQPALQISDRSLQPRGPMLRRQKDSTVNTVIFLFNHDIRLSSLRVVEVAEMETNKSARSLWELVSDSNSVPLKSFVYGMNPGGMKSAVAGAKPDSLQPGVKYRLMIKAGSVQAQHDFTPMPRSS